MAGQSTGGPGRWPLACAAAAMRGVLRTSGSNAPFLILQAHSRRMVLPGQLQLGQVRSCDQLWPMRLASLRGLSLGSLPASSQEVRCEHETDFLCLKPLRFEGFVTATKPPCLIHPDCQAHRHCPSVTCQGSQELQGGPRLGGSPGAECCWGSEVFHLEPHLLKVLLFVHIIRSFIRLASVS